MEEETLKETWAWLDEDFRLDTDSPLAISRSLWDDFTSSEGVVRSLFPGPHAEYSVSPSLSLERTESSDHSSSWDVVPDCSTSPLKRRCILQLHENEDWANPTSGSLENDNSHFVGARQNMQADDPSSPNSMWCFAAEESHSSVDDAMHRSAENWMVGCLSDDSDTSDVVEIPPPHRRVNVCIDAATSKTSMGTALGATPKSRQPFKATTLKVPSPLSHPFQDMDTLADKMPTKRRAHGKFNQSRLVNERCLHGKANQTILLTESTKPVLVYPFALVKPSGIQGDVTLQDINQRIKMAPSSATCAAKGSLKSLASPLSGKSVVGLTKIQTEGKGTITILRTRT